MQDPLKYPLPFLVRDMLAFEHALTFSLRIRSQSTITGVLTIRGMTREGIFTLSHTTTEDGVPQLENFRIPDIPIMASVVVGNGAYMQGDAFVTLELVANNDVLYELLSGFVLNRKSLSYPQGGGQYPRPNGGRLRVVNGTDPAVGAQILEVVPLGRQWRIIAIRFAFVTAAVVASRRVHLVLTDGFTDILDVFTGIDQLTSETRNYSCAAFGTTTDFADDNDILLPLPQGIILDEESEIKTDTTNMNAGDNFGAPKILVEEFLIST